MKLPISLPSFGKKQPEQNYYLILLLRDEKATAVILEEENKIVRVVGMNETHFQTPLENTSDEALLEILDKTISKAEETLPPSIQTEMTVFGVKDTWVEEKKIKKEFLDRLKTVGKALSLKPIGFLVISEAIAHLIQQEEGAPATAIVAEIGKYSVLLSLFRGGRLLETKSGAVEGSLPETVDTLLKHLTSVEVLPSRILLLNTEDDDSLSQSFITYQWSKTLPFLHMPQISILSGNFDARAAVQGAANQLELTVGDSTFPLSSTITPLTISEQETEEHSKKNRNEDSDEKKHHSKKDDDEKKEDTKDSALDEDKTTEPLEDIATTTVTAENFGFVQGKDIADLPFHSSNQPPVSMSEENIESSTSASEPFISSGNDTYMSESSSSRLTRQTGNSSLGSIHERIKALSQLMNTVLQRIHIKTLFSGGKSKGIIGVIVVLVLLIGIPIAYAYTSHADVTLIIKAKAFEDTENVTFEVDGSNDFKSNTLAVKTVTVSLDNQGSVPASGKKDIGEKAKGTVTLYNNNEGKKTVSAGTVITSSNNLDFTLDKDVTISSASGDAFSGTKPGTAQVSVTAKAIGTDSNLPSGTKFSVSGSSSVVAKNEAAFSGGTKKTVTVVAAADRDKLLLQIPKDLEGKAKEELAKKLSGDEQLLPFDLTTTIEKKEFDKAVGDETKTVTASITVSFSGLAYTKTDLNDYAKSIISDKAGTDNNTPDNTINTAVTNIKDTKENTYSADLTIKTGLLPKIDAEKLRQEIVGKSIKDASDLLMKLPQVESVDTKVKPGLPLLSGYLPRSAEHITVLTTSHE